MDFIDNRNFTLLTDLYQLTMLYGYFKSGKKDNLAVFDIFYRGVGNNYAVVAGLEQVIDYINGLKFIDSDIAYLRGLGLFDEDFLKTLLEFKFTGDIYSVPEGTVVFPSEPYFTVVAPIFEAQLIETAVLCILNHQTLIATKTSRIINSADGKPVAEFGLRRAQGPDAGFYGARAAAIAGVSSTSNVLAGKAFGIRVSGTMAHSFVLAWDNELTAFREFAKCYPNDCILLVDSYDTLKSGVPNAIRVFEEMRAKGHKPVGIRLDSGDIAYLSNEARKMLDAAGFEDVKIFASGDIDEKILTSLKSQNAKIDSWGIGTKLITSEDCPSLGGVYKLAAIEYGGKMMPKMKFSDTVAKVTNPGFKKIVRFYDKNSNKAIADLVALFDEDFSRLDTLEIFNPDFIWLKKILTNFYTKELAVPIFKAGKQVYRTPAMDAIRAHAKASMDELWEQYKREVNPHIYKVDLSKKLWELKQNLLSKKN